MTINLAEWGLFSQSQRSSLTQLRTEKGVAFKTQMSALMCSEQLPAIWEQFIQEKNYLFTETIVPTYISPQHRLEVN